MSSGWMTWMWAMCGRVSDGPLRGARGLDRVERRPDRPVADGVEMRLEAERVEGRDPAREPVRIDLEQAAVVGGRRRGRRQYGSSMAPVKFSRTPSIISLTLVGA